MICRRFVHVGDLDGYHHRGGFAGGVRGRYYDSVSVFRLFVQCRLGAQTSGPPVDGERIRIRPTQRIRQCLI